MCAVLAPLRRVNTNDCDNSKARSKRRRNARILEPRDATHGFNFSGPFGCGSHAEAHALSVAAAAAALAAAVMTATSSVTNSGCAVLCMEWAAPSNLRTAQPGSRA